MTSLYTIKKLDVKPDARSGLGLAIALIAILL